jgi:hypothetical protein
MRSVGPRWKLIEHAWAAAKLLADFLSLDDVAVARQCLPRGIGEIIAMPTAPRPIAESMQLLHSAPAVTDKIESFAPKPPQNLLCTKNLVRQVNKSVTPRLRPNAQTIGLVPRFPPITRGFADIARSPKGADLYGAGLLNRSSRRSAIGRKWPSWRWPFFPKAVTAM